MFRVALLAVGATTILPAQVIPNSTPAAKEALGSATGFALQGDMQPALAALRRVPEAQFAGKAAAVRTCILQRFGNGAAEIPAGFPPIASRALAAYRKYWHSSLLQPAMRDAREDVLRHTLAQLVDLPPSTDMANVETRLADQLGKEGIHALTGRTAPLRELMMWRNEARAMRVVPLPEGAHRTPVVMLDGFISFGWSGYATCDRSITGGWVRPDGIYAVKEGWGDLTDEPFLVSFLGHESQHFADKEHFGDLPSWELEYRAKLAELAMANRTLLNLLEAFSHNQGDDPQIPHSYANKRVLLAVATRLKLAPGAAWSSLDPARIKAAAAAELRADSARRQRVK